MADSISEQQAEFVRLLSGNSSQIYGFILMLSVSHADADDVFQETSVILWEKFDSYTHGTSFRAWACQIAYYEVLALRRKKCRIAYLSDTALSALTHDALEMLHTNDERKDILADCLDRLGSADRGLIEEKYYVRLSTEEIAQRSSRSTHSVYRALSRIHSLLLRCMRRQGNSGSGVL